MRVVRAVVIALLITVSAPPPSAHALTAPAVDPTLLPAAAAPTPPSPTVQTAPCVVPAVTTAVAHPTRFEAAHELSRGDGQRVAVIDTGVTRHRRLARVEGGGDYVSTGDGTTDCDGHGTMVAGIIAAAPDADGFSGVAPGAIILAIRQSSTVFAPADDPAAAGVGDVATLAKAVRTAADLGADVINISSIACASGSVDDGPLGAALAYAVDNRDVVVVAAAGNVGGAGRCPPQPEAPEVTWETATVASSPGWYDDYVLTVGSVGADDAPSEFTLPGPWVDVAAPGEQVVSLHPSGTGLVDSQQSFGRTLPLAGTSYAAPVVSGVVALVRSRFPELTARQVMRRIEDTARPVGDGWGPVTGHGVVDPVAALSNETEAVAPQPVPQPASPAAPPAAPRSSTATVAALCCLAALLVAGVVSRSRRGDGVVGEQRG
jgi:membrane-anchored mycosin MYCP